MLAEELVLGREEASVPLRERRERAKGVGSVLFLAGRAVRLVGAQVLRRVGTEGEALAH